MLNENKENSHPFYNYLDQIQLFINLYLNLNTKENKISILALLGPESHPKWVAQNLTQKGNKNSIHEIRIIFQDFFTKITEDEFRTGSSPKVSRQNSYNNNEMEITNNVQLHSDFSKIAVGLGMSLAFLNKQQLKENVENSFKQEQSGGSNSTQKSGEQKSVISSTTCRNSSSNLDGRILLISNLSTHNLQYQYMNLINSAYCAKAHNVMIDILTIEYIDPISRRQKVFVSNTTANNIQAIFSQVVEVSNGIFQHCSNLTQMFHYLNQIFISNDAIRKNFINTSSQARVDYRAASFDKGNLVEIGFVCSVCLAVYEEFSPVCGSCGNLAKIDFGMNIM